jgi:hypothetical protein
VHLGQRLDLGAAPGLTAGEIKRLLTIELNSQLRVMQVRGFANRNPTADESAIVVRWAKANGLGLRPDKSPRRWRRRRGGSFRSAAALQRRLAKRVRNRLVQRCCGQGADQLSPAGPIARLCASSNR